VWIWDEHLQRLGFRRRSDRYWQCQQRYGLSPIDHMSIFSWSEQRIARSRFHVELTEFHVTLARKGEFLHWYYHEHELNAWQPGGHTSVAELERLGLDVTRLRGEADEIAAEFIAALDGVLLTRETG